jgi:protein tyrosine phosphatase (PTP) superfamily phosphohydrolase (DUF442 family)
VFFNSEYIGDCSVTCAKYQGENSELVEKLTKLALGPAPDPPFPPPPEAALTKITEDIACSSQPTEEQLRKLPSLFGIASVVNLSSSLESSFFKSEGQLLKQQSVDFEYVNSPLIDLSKSSILRVMEVVKASKKPVLVHCDTGQRSLMIALLIATEGDTSISEDSFIAWGDELCINLKPYAKNAVEAAKSATVQNVEDKRAGEDVVEANTEDTGSKSLEDSSLGDNNTEASARKRTKIDD